MFGHICLSRRYFNIQKNLFKDTSYTWCQKHTPHGTFCLIILTLSVLCARSCLRAVHRGRSQEYATFQMNPFAAISTTDIADFT